ncbi:hypothetical protein EBZ80_00155 [bacterium]|nr:hypothetical protein [bacterium]
MVSVVAIAAEKSLAANLESCNASRSACIVASKELITGDRVGLFTSDDRLVAFGRITKMSGPRRIVVIDKAYSEIDGDERVSLLNNVTDPASIEDLYTIKRNKGRKMVDVSVATASFSVGSGAAGTETTGAWIVRSWKDLELTGRAMFSNVSGEISQPYVLRDYLGQESRGVDVQNFSANVYGGLAGVGYTLFGGSRFSLRGEVDAGAAYVAGMVGDSDMTSDSGFNTKMQNGFGLVVRSTATAMLNAGSWHVGLNLGQMTVQDASATTVGISLSKSID